MLLRDLFGERRESLQLLYYWKVQRKGHAAVAVIARAEGREHEFADSDLRKRRLEGLPAAAAAMSPGSAVVVVAAAAPHTLAMQSDDLDHMPAGQMPADNYRKDSARLLTAMKLEI